MKKRNWVLEGILCSIACFAVFGICMTQAKDNGIFQLEDVEGDRAYLADFPLEGHGGDEASSIRFSILDGNLETEYYSYSLSDLEERMIKAQYGLSPWEALFVGDPPSGDWKYHEWPRIIAAQGAAVEEKDTSYAYLFEKDGIAGGEGQTVTMDAVELFQEVGCCKDLRKSGITGWAVKDFEARYSTGLTLRDQTYFYTKEDHNFYSDNYNYYTYTDDGEEERNVLPTYITAIGEELYAVTAPDERCEGQTYVFRITPIDKNELYEERYLDEIDLLEVAQDRTTYGAVVPLIPVPDSKESRIVGLDAVPEKNLLLLYRTEGNTFIADVYDTAGKLLDSSSTALRNEYENYGQDDPYEYEDFAIANEIKTNIIPWEEGTSVELTVWGNLAAKKNDDHYGGIAATTGKLLFWIDNTGRTETVSSYKGEDGNGIVRGDKVLYLGYWEREEKQQIDQVLGGSYLYGEPCFKVCDKNSGETLYQGVLRTDFWQDDLKSLGNVNNAPKAGYIRGKQGNLHNDARNRSLQCYIAGTWEEEDRW